MIICVNFVIMPTSSRWTRSTMAQDIVTASYTSSLLALLYISAVCSTISFAYNFSLWLWGMLLFTLHELYFFIWDSDWGREKVSDKCSTITPTYVAMHVVSSPSPPAVLFFPSPCLSGTRGRCPIVGQFSEAVLVFTAWKKVVTGINIGSKVRSYNQAQTI